MSGDMSINIPNYMAFLYFPKNFTKDLSTYINDPGNYSKLAYVRITGESKYNLNLLFLFLIFY